MIHGLFPVTMLKIYYLWLSAMCYRLFLASRNSPFLESASAKAAAPRVSGLRPARLMSLNPCSICYLMSFEVLLLLLELALCWYQWRTLRCWSWIRILVPPNHDENRDAALSVEQGLGFCSRRGRRLLVARGRRCPRRRLILVQVSLFGDRKPPDAKLLGNIQFVHSAARRPPTARCSQPPARQCPTFNHQELVTKVENPRGGSTFWSRCLRPT
jgi:hypothetical protein